MTAVRVRRQTPGMCKHPLFETMKKCCTLPQFMKKGVYKNCKMDNRSTDKKDEAAANERACKGECVLRNQTLLTSTGTVDISKLTEQYLAASDSNWKPIVQAAITNCTSELAKVNSTAPPAGGCNPANGRLVWCINRYSLLNCPNSPCKTSDIEALRSCDPFRLLKKIG
ncbi:hypothetical protein B566_EDAN010726 [Ephemera danica]|nr:hypothetical protein B566_EDAN010726 [Ephemera danica]